MRALATIAALAATLGVAAGAQSEDLDVLLDRFETYMLAYERELSAVVAAERYDQQIVFERRRHQADGTLVTPGSNRRLESDVAFLRLPGNGEWLGVRDVLRVDGKPTAAGATRLQDLVKAAGPDFVSQAEAIVIAASEHNLGGPRSINMPSAPLEVLHPRHHPRFEFRIAGRERIAGINTVKLTFEEFASPTLIPRLDGGDLFSRGTAWVEPSSGRLWRVELRLRPDVRDYRMRDRLEAMVRVEFTIEKSLDILVPLKMWEEFYVENGRGTGEAAYSNYRRFTTAGRLVPQ